MKSDPLVSVIVITYNSAETLPWCLASVCAQTLPDLECLVVDDGSSDKTRELVRSLKDPRIRYVAHPTNLGRAAARQTGLDQAQGEYLCSVDADDWIVPERVEHQVSYMNEHPEVALCSGGMALVNSGNELTGIRCLPDLSAASRVRSPLRSIRQPPLAHGPCMMRTGVAREYGYRESMKLAQDIDFLLSILLEHRWAVLPTVDYCYREIDSSSLQKVLTGHLYWIRSLGSRLGDHPLSSLKEILSSLAKIGLYPLLFALRGKERVISARSRIAPPEVAESIERARQIVERKVNELFGEKGASKPDKVAITKRRAITW